MTQVITFQHKNITFFVCSEQRDALNEALEAKSLSKCEMNSFEFKLDFEDKVKTQPDDNKVYVPSNFSSEEFLELLDQEDPRGFLRGDDNQSVDDTKPQESSASSVVEDVGAEQQTEVKKETPIEKAQKQLAKVVDKLGDIKYVAKDKESTLTTEVEKIKASFETQINAFQDLITKKFLEDVGLLKDLGKDLPIEDIDKIYFVHGEGKLEETVGNKRKAVAKIIEKRSKKSNEYNLALNYRIAKYKTEVAKFIKSYMNAHIRLIAKQNDANINQPVNDIREKIDNSAQYKEEMAKVLQLKAKRASEKLEKTRKLEKARAMKQVAKAGIIAVLDNCVEEAKRKLNQQFDNAVALTKSEMDKLSNQIEGFAPKTNVEHYKLLVKNVLEILETNPDFKVAAIGVNSDSNSEVSEEEEVLNQTIQDVGGNATPDMQQFWQMMMDGMSQQMGQTSNGKVPLKV